MVCRAVFVVRLVHLDAKRPGLLSSTLALHHLQGLRVFGNNQLHLNVLHQPLQQVCSPTHIAGRRRSWTPCVPHTGHEISHDHLLRALVNAGVSSVQPPSSEADALMTYLRMAAQQQQHQHQQQASFPDAMLWSNLLQVCGTQDAQGRMCVMCM